MRCRDNAALPVRDIPQLNLDRCVSSPQLANVSGASDGTHVALSRADPSQWRIQERRMSQHDEARSQLEKRLRQLTNRIGKIETDLRTVPSPDSGERAVELENDEVLQQLDEQSLAEARQVQEALGVPHPVPWTHICAMPPGVAHTPRAPRSACDTQASRDARSGCTAPRSRPRRRGRPRGSERFGRGSLAP